MRLILNVFKQNIKWILKKMGLRIRFGYVKCLPMLMYDDDKEFMKLYEEIRKYTLVGEERAYTLYQLTKKVNNLNGDVAEIGVYKGGTAKLFAKMLDNTGKGLYLFDTFEGIPMVNSELDWHKQGDFSGTSFGTVKNLLSDFKNVQIVKGIFPKTAEPIHNKKFCLVHVDVDIYQSVKDCCEFFYPRMAHSGIMVFDDYGFPTCPGAKKAVDGFFRDKPDVGLYLLTGQYVVIRSF